MWVVTDTAVAAAPVPQTAEQVQDSANIAECAKILRAAFPNLV